MDEVERLRNVYSSRHDFDKIIDIGFDSSEKRKKLVIILKMVKNRNPEATYPSPDIYPE